MYLKTALYNLKNLRNISLTMKRLLSLLTFTSAVVFSYAQSPLYINVDPICMDRFEYHINGESKGVEFISYRVRQTAKDFVFLEVGAESTGMQLSIPDSKDCRNVKFTPDYIEKINAGEAQVFIIRKAEIGYNISPVYLASYMYADSSTVKCKSNGLSFFANLGHISNIDNLAQADSNSDMYYIGDSYDGCLKSYRFRKSSKETCKPNVDIDIIPELGVVRELTRVSPLNTHESMLNLVRINDVSVDTYINKICEGKANLVYMPTTYVVESTDLSNLPVTEVVIDGKTYSTDENTTAFNDFSDKFTVADVSATTIPAEYNTNTTVILTEKGTNTTPTKVIKTENINSKSNLTATEIAATLPSEEKKVEKIKCLNTSNAETHIVQQGETLYGISRRYGLTVEQLKLWNKLNTNTINTCAALRIIPPQSEKKAVRAVPVATVNSMTNTKAVAKEAIAVKSYEQPTTVRLTAKGMVEETNKTMATQQQHIVRAGETISDLAAKYGYTEERFRKMNNLGVEAILEEGQILKTNDCICPIPANYEAPSKSIKTTTVAKEILTEKGIINTMNSTTEQGTNSFKRMTIYIVENDDTLESIAEKYHITVAQLIAINGLDEKEALIPNQRIFVD